MRQMNQKETGIHPGCIKFNAGKHHLGYLHQSIQHWLDYSWEDMDSEIFGLGSNQFDMYTGELTPAAIVNEITQTQKKLMICTRQELRQWLGKAMYRNVLLSDGSRWVIRESADPVCFVHIHPGRNQHFVKRLKANHVKTAIALITGKINVADIPPDQLTPLINRIRMEKLALSPVRSASESKKIIETWDFLNKSKILYLIPDDERH